MPLCLHQTTSAAAGYRRSLEGYAKAGIRYVEVIPQHVQEFVKQDGMPAAKRLLSDLGLKAVSSGGVRGLAEPGPARGKAGRQPRKQRPWRSQKFLLVLRRLAQIVLRALVIVQNKFFRAAGAHHAVYAQGGDHLRLGGGESSIPATPGPC